MSWLVDRDGRMPIACIYGTYVHDPSPKKIAGLTYPVLRFTQSPHRVGQRKKKQWLLKPKGKGDNQQNEYKMHFLGNLLR